jgi:hypothetical protein
LAEEPKKGKAAETAKKPASKGATSKKGAPSEKREKPDQDEAAAAEAMAPDALMTTTLKVMDWTNKRRSQIGATLGVLALGTACFFGWNYYRASRELSASDLLAKGVMAEFAPVKSGEEDATDQKRIQFFASEDDKQKAALAAYAEAKAKYGDTGPGILARLGEAGVYLDRREWDQAIAAYTDVRNHPLANVDSNVRLRCIEGLGYAREGKGTLDDARRSFEELMNMDGVKSAKPLGLYHLARLDAGQGKNAEAITKLKAARDAITQPGAPSARYLHDNIEKLLGRLDPTSVHKAPAMPGAGGMPNLEGLPPGIDIEALKAQLGARGGGGGRPMPPMPRPMPPPPGK